MARTKCDCGETVFITMVTAYYFINDEGKLETQDVEKPTELHCIDCKDQYPIEEFEV